MRSLTLALLALAAAPSAADACERTRAGALEVSVDRSTVGETHASRLLVCDHRTGRHRVLRRAAYRVPDANGPRGRTIGAAAARGRRVAWAEARYAEQGTVVTLRVADARGRILRRFEIRRTAANDPARLGVAFLRDGRLAWIDPGGRGGGEAGGVFLDAATPGEPPLQIGERRGAAGLVAEDGATLKWHAGWQDQVEHRDVLPVRRRDGCPVRERFRTLRATREHVVSEAYYRTPDIKVTRVCLRATGRDPVVIQHGGRNTFGHGTGGDVTAVRNGFAVTSVARFNRYEGCVAVTVASVDLRTGTPVRSGTTPGCERAPHPRSPHAITPAGVPAWTRGGALRAVRADGSIAELDAGDIDGLRADGETFSWTRAGEARSVPAP